MVSESLNLWGNGAVTLPKAWRTRFPTRHFMAVEVDGGLLIKPILDVEYYEEKDGTFGLRFPMGIEAGKLATMMQQATREIDRKGRRKKGSSSKRRHG